MYCARHGAPHKLLTRMLDLPVALILAQIARLTHHGPCWRLRRKILRIDLVHFMAFFSVLTSARNTVTFSTFSSAEPIDSRFTLCVWRIVWVCSLYRRRQLVDPCELRAGRR